MRVLDKNDKEIDAEVFFSYKGYDIRIISFKGQEVPEVSASLKGEDVGVDDAPGGSSKDETPYWTTLDDAFSWIDEDIKCRNQESITFTCPDCGGHNLVQLQNVMTSYRVSSITKDGLGYDHCNPSTTGEAQVLSHHCHDCSYELADENGNPIDDVEKVFATVERMNLNAND